jgi:hypothetical protein
MKETSLIVPDAGRSLPKFIHLDDEPGIAKV